MMQKFEIERCRTGSAEPESRLVAVSSLKRRRVAARRRAFFVARLAKLIRASPDDFKAPGRPAERPVPASVNACLAQRMF